MAIGRLFVLIYVLMSIVQGQDDEKIDSEALLNFADVHNLTYFGIKNITGCTWTAKDSLFAAYCNSNESFD